MSLIRSVTSRTGRIAHAVSASVHRARVEGEKRMLERRHQTALAALGARTYALVHEGIVPGDAIADEIAEVEARLAQVTAAREAQAAGDTEHDAEAAFPMLAEEDPT